MQNANGFPSTKNNVHRMEDYVDLVDRFHTVVIIERGVNQNERLRNVSDILEWTRINHMKEIKNEQY